MDDLDTQKIGVGYIRESTEDQDKGFSPEAQEKGIIEYANRNNIKLTDGFYKDLISGKVASKRDDFQRMIEDAMQKKFEVIIVFHTSRFARNVQEARQYKDLLRKKLNIDVVSTTQNFGDFNDPSSFLNEGINELFDEYTSRQIGFWVKSGLMIKRGQGKPIGGRPPLGYVKKKLGWDNERNRPLYSKEWFIDKKESEIIRRMFKMYASGKYSMEKIAETFTKEGLTTKAGHPFTYSSIKCSLQNKSYLGVVWSPRKELPDLPSVMHKAIIEKELFDQCQDVLKERKGHFGRPVAKHRFYLLQGLVYCYSCIKHMKGNEDSPIRRMQPSMYCEYHKRTTASKVERLHYACKFHRENKTCTQTAVKCELIDKQVIQYMGGLKLPDEVIQLTLEKLQDMFKFARKDKRQDERLPALIAKKSRLRFLFEEAGHLTPNEYLFKVQKVDEEIEQLERQGVIKSMTTAQEEQFMKKTEKFLKDFGKFWDTGLNQEEMREWIKLVIKRVWVKDKKVVAIEPRDDFKPLFKSHKLTVMKVIVRAPVLAPVYFSKNSNQDALLAQLDRVSGFEPEGRGFESLRAHIDNKKIPNGIFLFYAL